MLLAPIKIYPLDPNNPTREVGFGIKKGGIITLDTPLTEYFKELKVGTGGDLVIRGIDNNLYWVPAVVSGGWVPAWGYEIVTSGDVDGETKTTTATNIAWFGGQ